MKDIIAKPLLKTSIRATGKNKLCDFVQKFWHCDVITSMSENKFVEQLQSGKITNRLESAKNAIREFISRRPNDRIGLIGFADLAYSFVPPTLDHALLLERLQALKPGELGNATGIASPIGNAVKRLKNSDSPRRVMVLFTDGENTADNQLTPQAAAETSRDLNVIIHASSS